MRKRTIFYATIWLAIAAGLSPVYALTQEELIAKIQAAGGRIITPRTEISPGMGAFAVFTDPVGNEFGLYEEPRR